VIVALVIVGGVLVLVGTILTLVRATIARERQAMAAALHRLEAEGIRLDAGPVRTTVRFRDFRAPGRYYGVAIVKTRRHVVLTDQQLAILGGRPMFHTPVGELRRWQVGLDGARLRLVSDDPPGATGHVDLRVSVPDAPRWLTTLRDAGCTLLA
jgi:type II secretory pathway pseudopilin PulG